MVESPAWHRSLLKSILLAAAACVGYMLSASTLIILNKFVMSTDGFAFPMALGTLGMGFSSLAAHIYCAAFGLEGKDTQVGWKDWVMRYLPVGFFMAISLYTGNLVRTQHVWW